MMRICSMHRYPVKSMAGETLETVRMWWHGFEADRRYAFVRSTSSSHFPWLTAREVPQLIRYHASVSDPANAPKSPIQIVTPDQRSLTIDAAGLRAELAHRAGEPIHLMHLGRGAYDSSAGISIISTTTIKTLSEIVDFALDPARFRANLVIETDEQNPFPEQTWLGKTLVLGSHADAPRVRIIRPIPRCMIVNLDPATAQQHPAVLRAITHHNQQRAGVYAVPESVGAVNTGDELRLI